MSLQWEVWPDHTKIWTGPPWPRLSSEHWGQSSAAARLERACQEQGHRPERLPSLAAVNRLAELQLCHEKLVGDPRPARAQLCDLLSDLISPALRPVSAPDAEDRTADPDFDVRRVCRYDGNQSSFRQASAANAASVGVHNT